MLWKIMQNVVEKEKENELLKVFKERRIKKEI